MPARNMKLIYVSCAIICSFWSIVSAVEPAKSGCLEKEKARTLLETAENLLSKASAAYPSCKEESISTNQSDCGNEKSLAYIEISKKLISDVRKNFPSCFVNVKKNETKEEDDIDDDEQDKSQWDCSKVRASGQTKNGIYTIWPRNSPTGKPLKVYCDMDTDSEGWTVIQRRGKYKVQQDFDNDWESYKNGFGNLNKEFWLGNENIRVLCLNGCRIRFDMTDAVGVYYYAYYNKFLLSNNYRLDISGYSGNATDAIGHHNNYDFSTKDTSGKAREYHSGWWHGEQYYCNLNGIYQPAANGAKYVYWWKKPDDYVNLSKVEMKVKPI